MFYTYSIKNLETGKVYIGSRTRKVMLNRKPEDDLGVKYFSSASDKELRRAINDGKVSYRVIKEYSNAKECVRDENELIRLFWLFFGKENSYNHFYRNCKGENLFSMGGVIHTKEHNIKISESHKGKHLSDKTKDKISEGLNNMSDEEKQNLYKKRSERIKEAYNNMSDEEKQNLYKNISERIKEAYNNMSDEEKAARGKKISEGLNNMSDEEKQNLYKKRGERISEALKGKHKPLFKYQTPSGEIKIMSNQHAQRHHSDWVCLGPVE